MSKNKKIIFLCTDDEMYEGLLEMVSDIKSEFEEDLENDTDSVVETEDEIIVTINSKIE